MSVVSGSRPIARTNAADVNVLFDHASIMMRERKAPNRIVNALLADHQEGCYDVMEHDVLLEKRNKPGGSRALEAFSSISNMSTDDFTNLTQEFKYAGVAVTPYAYKLGSGGFEPGQGFVATFSGTNTVRVAEDVSPGDILRAIKPSRGSTHPRRGGWKMEVKKIAPGNINNGAAREWVVGRCVQGARKGGMATVVMTAC